MFLGHGRRHNVAEAGELPAAGEVGEYGKSQCRNRNGRGQGRGGYGGLILLKDGGAGFMFWSYKCGIIEVGIEGEE